MDYKRLIYMNIIYECNSRCLYCISHSTKNQEIKKFNAFNLIKRADAELHFNESDIFIICGGEPTISPQFFDIFMFLSQKKCHIIVYTNGRKLSNANFLKLLGIGDSRWIIPLYGLERQHDYYTNTKGSFIETYESLNKIADKNLANKISIKFLIKQEDQIKDIKKLIEMLKPNYHEFNFTLILTNNNINERTILAEKISPIINELYKSNFTVKIANTPLCYMNEEFLDLMKIEYNEKLNKNFENFFYIGISGTTYEKDINHFMLGKCKDCSYNVLCVENCLKYLVLEDGKIHLGVE